MVGMKGLIKYFVAGWLIAALYVAVSRGSNPSVTRSIGGPIEIARNYHEEYRIVLLFFVKGIVVPCIIGMIVYGILRWRHPEYQASIFSRCCSLCLCS